jgi:hypothetical protein
MEENTLALQIERGRLVCAHCMHFEKGKNRQALHALKAKERECVVACLLC